MSLRSGGAQRCNEEIGRTGKPKRLLPGLSIALSSTHQQMRRGAQPPRAAQKSHAHRRGFWPLPQRAIQSLRVNVVGNDYQLRFAINGVRALIMTSAAPDRILTDSQRLPVCGIPAPSTPQFFVGSPDVRPR
jgi:hypothetical protein